MRRSAHTHGSMLIIRGRKDFDSFDLQFGNVGRRQPPFCSDCLFCHLLAKEQWQTSCQSSNICNQSHFISVNLFGVVCCAILKRQSVQAYLIAICRALLGNILACRLPNKSNVGAEMTDVACRGLDRGGDPQFQGAAASSTQQGKVATLSSTSRSIDSAALSPLSLPPSKPLA